MSSEEEPLEDAKPSSSAALRSVVVFWGTVALIQFAVFCLLRSIPRLKCIYNVRDTVERLKCELAGRDLGSKWNIVSWIPAVLRATEDEIFAQVGLDALCYLRTVKMGMKLSLMGCFIALWSIPTYYTSPHTAEEGPASEMTNKISGSQLAEEQSYVREVPLSNFNVTDTLDKMSMGNTHMGDTRMISGLLSAYVISLFAMWLLRSEFNWFIIQRYRYLQRTAPQNYSLFIHHLPPNLRSVHALREYFGVFFNDILEIHLLPSVSHVSKFCDVSESLKEEAADGADGGGGDAAAEAAAISMLTVKVPWQVKKIPKLEKMCAKRDEISGQIAHNEAVLERVTSGARSLVGSFRKTNNEVDTAKQQQVQAKIDKDTAALEKLKQEIAAATEELEQEWDRHEERVRRRAEGETVPPPATILDAAFITFKTLKSVTCARQLNHHELPFNVLAEEAPVPNHIVWHNCGLNHYKKTAGRVLASALTTAICLFWVIPITFVSSFQKVEEMKKFGPPGCQEAGNCPIKVATDFLPLLETILAILAPLALISLTYMLPVIMWYVVSLEGHIGMNTFHASLFFKLTLFMITQTFFVSAIAGAVLTELENFINEPITQGQTILANSLPAQAVTFMSLIFVKTTYKMMMELLRPRSALYGWMRTWIGPRMTEAERNKDYFGLTPFIWVLRPFSSPGPLKYHVLFPDLVLMFIVLFVYSVLSPITNLVLLPAFMFLNIGNRYQMIHYFDPGNDTGGQLWPQFARYYMVSLLIAQVAVLGVLGLSESGAAPLMIPLIVITVLFSSYMRSQHPRVAQNMPLFSCHQADMAHEAKGDGHGFLVDKYKQKALIRPPADTPAAKADPESDDGQEREVESSDGTSREGREAAPVETSMQVPSVHVQAAIGVVEIQPQQQQQQQQQQHQHQHQHQHQQQQQQQHQQEREWRSQQPEEEVVVEGLRLPSVRVEEADLVPARRDPAASWAMSHVTSLSAPTATLC